MENEKLFSFCFLCFSMTLYMKLCRSLSFLFTYPLVQCIAVSSPKSCFLNVWCQGDTPAYCWQWAALIGLLSLKLPFLSLLTHCVVWPCSDHAHKPFAAHAMGKICKGFFWFLFSTRESIEQLVHHRYQTSPSAFESQPYHFLHVFWTAMNSSFSAAWHYNISAVDELHKDTKQMNILFFLFISSVFEAGFACSDITWKIALGNIMPFSKIRVLKLINYCVLQNISQ